MPRDIPSVVPTEEAFVKIWIGVLVCALCRPQDVNAQDREPTTAGQSEAPVGSRVRLTRIAASSAWNCSSSDTRHARVLTGTLSAYEGNEIMLTVPECDRSVIVPLASVKRLEVAQGRRSAFRRGAVVGATVGLSIGAVAALICSRRDGYCDDVLPNAGRHEMVLYPTAVLGAAGALLAAPFREDRWQDVTPRRAQVQLTPLPRGLGVSMIIPLASRRPAKR